MERLQGISKSPIPQPATPILGRQQQLSELIQLLEQNNVVTITGTGGIGKTRVAIEICHQTVDKFWDGIVYVSLATFSDADSVMPALADELGITEMGGRTLAAGVAEVLSTSTVLLVLDNLEHIPQAAREISDLVALCPQIKILCTSRTPLKILAEVEFSMPPLPVPARAELTTMMEYPAITLFLRRAKRVHNAFELTPENATALLQVCRYLDGLPLALELAASRLRILTLDQLFDRLKHSIDILSTGSKDLPERHQTLNNTIEWSHELLSESEKQLFRRLSVFTRGFTLEAIEQVCYDTEAHALKPVDEIESLVDKALVQRLDSNQRFTLLQTIKDYASKKLCDAHDEPSTRMRHAQYYHKISVEVLKGTMGERQPERMHIGLMEEPNILQALDHLLELARQGNTQARELGFSICGNLWTFWHIHGKHVTTKAYVNDLLESDEGDTPGTGKCGALFSLHVACFTLGEIELSKAVGDRLYNLASSLNEETELVKGLIAQGFGNMFSNLEESIGYNDRAVKQCRKLNISYWLALTLWQKGIFHLISQQLDMARESYSESLGLFRVLQENEGIGIAQSGLCMLEFIAGNYDRALELYSDALAAFVAIGDRPEEARTYSEMSWTCLAKGDTHTAMHFALKSIRAHQEIGSDRGIGLSLYAFAAIEAVKGRKKKAVEIAAAAEHYASQKGVAIERGANNHGELYLENAKKELSEAEIEQAESTGIRYTIKDILRMVEERASLKPFETTLIKNLDDSIEANLSDASFGVVELSQAVAMSQIQLYRKLKALKSQSPSQFIREYRLQKGRELLKSTNANISEIAYQVGFVDPNYFSRIFTKEFSITPTEFRNS